MYINIPKLGKHECFIFNPIELISNIKEVFSYSICSINNHCWHTSIIFQKLRTQFSMNANVFFDSFSNGREANYNM